MFIEMLQQSHSFDSYSLKTRSVRPVKDVGILLPVADLIKDSCFISSNTKSPVLSSRPELTWRDVQHIVVQTARIPNAEEEGWTVNGAGHHVSHHFGFGALDCGQMVEAAQTWTNVPPQHQCEVAADNPTA